MARRKKFTAIDSFSGAGGLSLGLSSAGFEVVYAFDNNECAVNSYNINIPGKHCLQEDIFQIKGSQLLNKLRLKKGELDLFAGGPPCQGFSRQKRGAHNGDSRNNLVLEYGRLVNELKPKTFLLENVDMLGMKRGLAFIRQIETMLKSYDLYPHFYDSSDYKLAQTRVRFVCVGVRKDLKKKFNVPTPTTPKRKLTIRDVIGKMPEPLSDFSPHPKYFNHQLTNVTALNIKRFSYVPQGGGWKDIPFNLRLKCHQIVDTSKGGWPDVYGRLEWNGQCPTITGGFDSFTRGRFGHPEFDRAITAREAALIQGFPIRFEFQGNRGEVRKQIGNAVPPPLAKSIGTAIMKLLKS